MINPPTSGWSAAAPDAAFGSSADATPSHRIQQGIQLRGWGFRGVAFVADRRAPSLAGALQEFGGIRLGSG